MNKKMIGLVVLLAFLLAVYITPVVYSASKMNLKQWLYQLPNGFLYTKTVATLPSSGAYAGAIVFCSGDSKFYGATTTVTSTSHWVAFN